MNKLFQTILDLIFPPKCEVCKGAGREALCSGCFTQIRFMKPQLGVYCVSAYEGILREAIHRLKFNKRKKLAEPLGILLVQYLSGLTGFEMREMDAIVPVPLHQKRLRQRGFNQVELIASVLKRYFGTEVIMALERVRDTKAQFDLPRDKRFSNVAGAFRVKDSKAVFNKRLLILDDIYTTGATIAECSKALQIAGAKRVEILTLSRAVDRIEAGGTPCK